jgi:hypothetical protein
MFRLSSRSIAALLGLGTVALMCHDLSAAPGPSTPPAVRRGCALRVFGTDQKWSFTLRLTGSWNSAKSEWVNGDFRITKASDAVSSDFLKTKLELKKLGDSGTLNQPTTGKFVLLFDPKSLRPQMTKDKVPRNIARYFKKTPGTKWALLRAAFPFTLVALKMNRLDAEFALREGGVALISGATVACKQEGTITLYMAQFPTGGLSSAGLSVSQRGQPARKIRGPGAE